VGTLRKPASTIAASVRTHQWTQHRTHGTASKLLDRTHPTHRTQENSPVLTPRCHAGDGLATRGPPVLMLGLLQNCCKICCKNSCRNLLFPLHLRLSFRPLFTYCLRRVIPWFGPLPPALGESLR
jgi:hypothetical protein